MHDVLHGSVSHLNIRHARAIEDTPVHISFQTFYIINVNDVAIVPPLSVFVG